MNKGRRKKEKINLLCRQARVAGNVEATNISGRIVPKYKARKAKESEEEKSGDESDF